MSTKRIVSIVLILSILVSLLAGCALKPKDKKNDPPDQQTQQGPQDSTGQQATAGNTLPSGHLLLSAAEPPKLDGFLQAAPDPIGKPGVDFQLLETGDPSDWTDMPAPLVNPLGSKSLYSNARYRPLGNDYADISWLEGVSEVTQRVYGERWELGIDNEKLTTNYIRWYAKELDATLLNNTDDRVTFRLEKGSQIWWASATWSNLEYTRADLVIVKQDILPYGQTITLKPSDLIDGQYCFMTKAGSGDFVTAFVEINGSDAASAYVKAAQYKRIGTYARSFSYSKDVEAKYCRRYALDNIPQTDEPLFWYVSFGSGTHVPESVTIRFEKTGSIIPVNIGEQMGSIRVFGAPGSATLNLQSALFDIRYEGGYSLNGAIDSEGNTVFHVPAGYYNIKAALPGEGAGGIRMVPVSSGELTEVVLPNEFKSTYSSFESIFGNFNTNQGSISIHDNKDNSDTAEVSFLINDPLKRDVFPEKKDVTITEGGIPGEILDIKRQTAPVNVVLVIDTSGSMGNFMKPTIEAAKKFVSGLPDKTNIRLISFESNITEYKEAGREAVLKPGQAEVQRRHRTV